MNANEAIMADDISNVNIGCDNLSKKRQKNILIVGDGNFSFSLAYVQVFLHDLQPLDEQEAHKQIKDDRPNIHHNLEKTRYHIYATSFDDENVIRLNESSLKNIENLKKNDLVTVLHGIDATNLNFFFNDIKFIKIIFNFPHVGGKSNINACRKLLLKFFQSAAAYLENEGQIFVSLCKGQGGIPIDASRKGYGNTWQVATQAAAAGLVLVDVMPYNYFIEKPYIAAGYRGRLDKGFHRDGALTHIFQKGERQSWPLMEAVRYKHDQQSLVFDTEKHYKLQLECLNPYYNRLHPLSKTVSALNRDISKFVNETSHTEASNTHMGSIESSILNCFQGIVINDGVKHAELSPILSSNKDWIAVKALHNRVEVNSGCFYFTETFINSSIEISPFFYPVYQEAVLVCPAPNFQSTEEFAEQIRCLVEKIALSDSAGSRKAIPVSAEVASFPAQNARTTKYPHFDSKLIPNFLSDINMKKWLECQPEVTLSRETDNINDNTVEGIESTSKPVEYKTVAFSRYEFSEREQRFFEFSYNPCSYSTCIENTSMVQMKIGDIVVARCGILKTTNIHTSSKSDRKQSSFNYVAVFFFDQLCMAVKSVDDIRLFWSTDEKYLKELCQEKINDYPDTGRPKPTVKYPLCYRHDLCFWLSEYECEKTLLTAIRYYTHDTMHSVRLLRILKHEETGSISYCYRMIYSRCDGPLSHKETVGLQNKLRLALLEMKFELR